MSAEQLPQPSELFEQPFAEFVTKTANGCNMQPLHENERNPLSLIQPGCDHCYMYTHSKAWQEEPAYMDQSVIEQTAFRIGEHAATHGLAHVRIIAHGGEPLLALTKDPDYYSRYAEILHRHIDPSGAKVHLFMQTNGLLLNDRKGPQIINQLKAAGFTIGLSIDGDQAANDLHRRDKAGRSTHSRAERAARLLDEYQANWGVLGVIDPRTNPEGIVEYLASLKPQAINLFPMHAHNSAPPIEHTGALSLGEWQKRALDYYIDWAKSHPGTDGPPFEMPIYDNYLRMAFGAPSLNDTAGARVTQELFITPSGKWERLDTLKSADDGAVFTGLNIFEHSLDDVRHDPGIVARRMGLSALASECQGCDLLNLCFGNHYPNRYKRPEEPLTPQSSVEKFVEAFRHPSAHCKDHKLFLGHVSKLVGEVAEQSAPNDSASTFEEMNIMEIPDDVREIAKPIPLPLNELLRNFRVGAYAYNKYWQKQANRYIIGPVIAPRLAHTNIEDLPHSHATDTHDIRQGILARHITGRLALEQLRNMSELYDEGRIVYYALEHDESLTTDMHLRLSKDYNDAVVNSILSGIEGRVDSSIKVGGYWFIGRNIIESLITDSFTDPGRIAVFRRGDTWQPDPFINGEAGIDYWKAISMTQKPEIITVTSFDLPGDVLVVDPQTQYGVDISTIIEDIKNSYGQYDNAQAFASAMQDKGILIEPLLGTWPEDTRWDSPSSGVARCTLPENNANSPAKQSYYVINSNGSYYGGPDRIITKKEQIAYETVNSGG